MSHLVTVAIDQPSEAVAQVLATLPQPYTSELESHLLHSNFDTYLPSPESAVMSLLLEYETHIRPLTLKAGLVFLLTGAAIIIYFREERLRMERKKIAEQTKGIGRPKVGGPFNLIDHDGNPFTEQDLKGKYALVYFGFTHCPDICPDELDKMADMIDKVKAECGDVLVPVMISCDPARDKPSVLKPYLKEFHDDIIGLTGEYDEIKRTCKEYRVYFSTPPTLKAGQDYLVDHSIYFYLMDPEGDFVEAIGRNFTADQAARVIRDHVKDWDKPLDKTPRRHVEAKPVAA
ncbi:hypothetical protein BLS_003256 [Venturia inaequalis]|uniref:Thioredoxin domain-containing protein n=1 Tax=Venturia inaequalis TaxID=5025 RepID=A0A8H3UQY4_VENIN|nr:hypothetical protein BLS_003256 [Venturia inaequalis]